MTQEPVQKKITEELGSVGLIRYGNRGLVYEEPLTELTGDRGRKAFQEMSLNDDTVGGMLFAIETRIRKVAWRVEGPDHELNEFIESCMHDMSSSWNSVIVEILSMLVYGWSWHEIVYKQRKGSNNDPKKRSKFSDGMYGWRKIPIRAQHTLYEWEWDEEGGLQAFKQTALPDLNIVSISINRSLLFRTTTHANNPEGRSILRTAYRSWYFKKRVQDIEGIGVERDLAGLPVIYRTAEMAKQYDEVLEQIVTSVRNDDQAGILLPLARDEHGNKLLEFSLMSSSGSKKQIDPGAVIARYDHAIARSILADFILLGSQSTGSFALSSSKIDVFTNALDAILESIASVFNMHAIPRLLAINGITVNIPPRLAYESTGTQDLGVLGAFITAVAGAGMPLFPDDNLENHLRKVAKLPEKSEDADPQPKRPGVEEDTTEDPEEEKEDAPESKAPEEDPEEDDGDAEEASNDA